MFGLGCKVSEHTAAILTSLVDMATVLLHRRLDALLRAILHFGLVRLSLGWVCLALHVVISVASSALTASI